MVDIETKIFSGVVLWHGTNFYPIDGNVPIVCCTKNGKILTFNKIRDKKDWEWKIDKYSLACWCYTYQLVPDGI